MALKCQAFIDEISFEYCKQDFTTLFRVDYTSISIFFWLIIIIASHKTGIKCSDLLLPKVKQSQRFISVTDWHLQLGRI